MHGLRALAWVVISRYDYQDLVSGNVLLLLRRKSKCKWEVYLAELEGWIILEREMSPWQDSRYIMLPSVDIITRIFWVHYSG